MKKVRVMKKSTAKKKAKAPRSAAKLTTLDDFLKAEGKLEEFEAIAIKEVLAWQLAEAIEGPARCRKRAWPSA